MQNLTSVLENDTQKLLWDFDIQEDHLISARRPDLIIISNNNNKKKTIKIVGLAITGDHIVKLKETEKKHKCLELRGE